MSSDTPPPTLTRLQSAIRNTTILSSIIAHPTTPPKRLFRRPTNPPPVPYLVLSTSSKPPHLRLHQLYLPPPPTRVIVSRTWPISDLRKIEGVQQDDSPSFALHFSGQQRALIWKCESERDRALFLWSLLRNCVQGLSRAPPVDNLKLLELQQLAEGEKEQQHHLDDEEEMMEEEVVGNEMNREDKVKRTLSEPKASALYDDEDWSAGVKADTIGGRVMNIDERAFLAAAKRMGRESDPKARLFQVRERKVERKLFRLTEEERKDLGFALELWKGEGGFGNWCEQQIEEMEVQNVKQVVLVEEGGWDVENIVGEMKERADWLGIVEDKLTNYAEMSEGIWKGVWEVEVRRRNIEKVGEKVDEILRVCEFDGVEKGLLEGIKWAQVNVGEIEVEEFEKAVKLIVGRLEKIEELGSVVGEMKVLKDVKEMLMKRKREASNVLLNVLHEGMREVYEGGDGAEKEKVEWVERARRREFVKSLKSLMLLGRESVDELMDIYVEYGRKSVLQGVKEAGDGNYAEGLVYAFWMEVVRVFELLEDVFKQFGNDDCFVTNLLSRLVDEDEFIQKFITREQEHNSHNQDPILRKCAPQHAAQTLDTFNLDPHLLPHTDQPALTAHITAHLSQTPHAKTRLTSSLSTSTISHPHTLQAMTCFQAIRTTICTKCNHLTNTHIQSAIVSLTNKHNIRSEHGRATFFTAVQSAIDLCYHLATQPAPNSQQAKPLCERLVAAVMRTTESRVQGVADPVSDAVKLQSYGYACVRLGAQSEAVFLEPLAHLSRRVWKHVLQRWVERECFQKAFKGIRFGGHGTESQKRLREAVSKLIACKFEMEMKKAMSEALGAAAETGVVILFYKDLVAITKDRLEHMLSKAKKERADPVARTKLLSFSKELLSSLRTQLMEMQAS